MPQQCANTLGPARRDWLHARRTVLHMAVKRLATGDWQGYVYNPARRKKDYVGTYPTREQAEAAVAAQRLTLGGRINGNGRLRARALADGWRRCPGCRRPFKPEDEWQKRCSLRCEALVKRRKHRRAQRINDHWVYYCFDAQGDLLYVGVTSTGLRRHREHGRDKPWWKKVAAIQVEHFDTRDDALASEAAAIALYRPPCNALGVAEEQAA